MSVPGEILLSAEVIHRRVETLAAEISRDYRDKPLLIVGVLKGSFIFLADLVRAMTIPVRLDFLGVASYGDGMISSGEVKVFKDLNEPVAGQDLLLVEDIVDSGRTTEVLLQLLQVRKPASIRLCTLLDKPARRVHDVTVDYRGFQIEDFFVVGYGMDVEESFRNLPAIYRLME